MDIVSFNALALKIQGSFTSYDSSLNFVRIAHIIYIGQIGISSLKVVTSSHFLVRIMLRAKANIFHHVRSDVIVFSASVATPLL